MVNYVLLDVAKICAPMLLMGTPERTYEDNQTYMVIVAPYGNMEDYSPQSRIRDYQCRYALTPEEQAMLDDVVTYYEPEEIENELKEAIRWIMGARKYNNTKPLSLETIDRARELVEAGLTPFVPQHVD